MKPTLHCHAHFSEMAFEEVVSRNEYQLFRISGLGDEFLQCIVRPILIVIAADEELGFAAIP